MKAGKVVLIGCGAVAAVLLLGLALLVIWVRHVSQDPKGVVVTVESPEKVALNEEFEVAVVIKNERPKRRFGLTDIDLADEYLEGFLILGTEPEAKSSMHVPIDNSRSYTFDRPVPAGQTSRFVFRLRAAKPGVFRGDVDVCEGGQFLSTLMQTVVEAGTP